MNFYSRSRHGGAQRLSFVRQTNVAFCSAKVAFSHSVAERKETIKNSMMLIIRGTTDRKLNLGLRIDDLYRGWLVIKSSMGDVEDVLLTY